MVAFIQISGEEMALIGRRGVVGGVKSLVGVAATAAFREIVGMNVAFDPGRRRGKAGGFGLGAVRSRIGPAFGMAVTFAGRCGFGLKVAFRCGAKVTFSGCVGLKVALRGGARVRFPGGRQRRGGRKGSGCEGSGCEGSGCGGAGLGVAGAFVRERGGGVGVEQDLAEEEGGGVTDV